jgi:hypothetical protein
MCTMTGQVTGHCVLRQHLQGFSESAMCRICGQEEEFSYHIRCQYPALARHRIEILGCAWLELVDIRVVLTLALHSGPFRGS